MDELIKKDQSRRKFLTGLSAIMIGAPFIASGGIPENIKLLPKGKRIWDELSPEETELTKQSRMAANISKYRKADHSCASTILASAVEYMNLDQSYTDVAGSYGGGIGKRDLCGFLTGAFMAIGLHSGQVKKGRKRIQNHSQELSDKFWEWWMLQAPIHCIDMYKLYDKKGFKNMMFRVAMKVEELITV